MSLPFTIEQLLEAFERYNLAIWPMQVFAYLLGITALVLAIRRTKTSDQLITAILAFFWLFTGVGFVLLYFAPLYPLAYGFAVLCTLQGILFLISIKNPRISFNFNRTAYAVVGLVLIAYAMLGYPLIGYVIDHVYPQSLSFGLTPCPVTVFTFGMFLLAVNKIPKQFLIIPLLWALSGVIPASIGILEDIGLIAAGVLAAALIFLRDRKLNPA
jgi:hypothetical protein